MDFSRAQAALIASSGSATSMSLRGERMGKAKGIRMKAKGWIAEKGGLLRAGFCLLGNGGEDGDELPVFVEERGHFS
ncbi:MAG: hypothetical protein NTZ05_11495 [Chloroflexi bacterium]|nr:hypothetical protein [Chloroflexota bacterium]